MPSVRCKIVLDIETAFDDGESGPDTLLFCVQEDLDDAGLYTIYSAEVVNEKELT